MMCTGNTQEVVALSQHDCKIVDWDIKHQHKQTNDGIHVHCLSYAITQNTMGL